MQYTFGVDVGGTAIKYGLFGDGLIEKWASPTRVDANGSQILPDSIAKAFVTFNGLFGNFRSRRLYSIRYILGIKIQKII